MRPAAFPIVHPLPTPCARLWLCVGAELTTIRPAVGPGRGLSGPMRSNTTAAPTTGTIAEANSRPLLLSTPLTTPSAAASPKHCCRIGRRHGIPLLNRLALMRRPAVPGAAPNCYRQRSLGWEYHRDSSRVFVVSPASDHDVFDS